MPDRFTESLAENAALVWPKVLRVTPLPKLISGEVRVGDVERFIGRYT
jgi:hypothetical protein